VRSYLNLNKEGRCKKSGSIQYVCEQLNSDQSFTTEEITTRVKKVFSYMKKVKELLNQPQVEQRSQEWYDMRKGRLTASSLAQAIGKSKYNPTSSLVKMKAFPELEKPFDSYGSPALRHGIILEDMTLRCYQQRLGIETMYAFGMIPHPTLSCFGASPDGINDLGIMVEIKTPYSRKIDGSISNDYMFQMQGQMAVCGLEECDFVEAEIVMNCNIEEYLASVPADSTVDHGMIVEYFNDLHERQFDYSPPNLTPIQCFEWARNIKKQRIEEYGVNNVLLLQVWILKTILVQRVNFDRELWDSMVPKIERFWQDVVTMRIGGHTPDADASDAKPKKIRKVTPKTLDLVVATEQPYCFVDSDDET